MYVNPYTDPLSPNHCCSEKVMSYIFWVLVCILAFCLSHIILSPMACLAIPYTSTSSYRGHAFWKKKLLSAKCVFIFFLQCLSEIFLILRRIQRNNIKNIHTSSFNAPVILIRLQWNINVLDGFFEKILKYKTSWKSVQWGQSFSIQTYRQLIVDFRTFTTAPKHGFS